MARLPRYVIPGQPQHIIQRGNNRQVIFAADADFQFFRDALIDAADNHGLAIHAYVWMTNHIHLLATPKEEDSISKVFQSVGRKYVQYFNYTYQRSGTLWEGRYRATVVDSERYLLTVMRYIELNPVRADMVAHPRDYAWSSYRRNADGEAGANADWLTPHREYRGDWGVAQKSDRRPTGSHSGLRCPRTICRQSAIARIRDGLWAAHDSRNRWRRWGSGARPLRVWGDRGRWRALAPARIRPKQFAR